MTVPLIAVGIPTIRNNDLLFKCVKECLAQDVDVEIFVMTEEESPKEFHNDRVKFVNCGPLNMSQKRNLVAKMSQAQYISFIDSDAYPAKNWLANAMKEFVDPEIGMVGGPELSPEGEPLSERYVGLASRSGIITGAHAFRKQISPRRFFSEMSACNLMMKRAEYLGIGGMDEKLYIGEDNDLGRRVGLTGKKLLFSPEVVVFHKNRSFIPFLIQRYARGMAVAAIIKTFFRTSIQNRKLEKVRFELFIAPGFIFFTLTALLIPIVPLWAYVYTAAWAFLLSVISVETVKNSEKTADYPGVFCALLCGSLLSGIGAFLSLFGIEPNIKKYYRNINDQERKAVALQSAKKMNS